MKYINAEELKKMLVFSHDTDDMRVGDVHKIMNLIDVMDGINYEPPGTAEWVRLSNHDDGYCSRCGFGFPAGQGGEPPMFGAELDRRSEHHMFMPGIAAAREFLRLCPNCGAHMRGAGDGEVY